MFLSIAILWRPTSNNRKLALSDELAQTEEEADLYDVDALLPHGEGDEGADELKDSYPMRRRSVSERSQEEVVFEVGSDDEDERHVQSRRGDPKSRYREQGEDEERERLRYSEGDDRQLDITTQHGDMSPTSFDAPPPEYRRSTKND